MIHWKPETGTRPTTSPSRELWPPTTADDGLSGQVENSIPLTVHIIAVLVLGLFKRVTIDGTHDPRVDTHSITTGGRLNKSRQAGGIRTAIGSGPGQGQDGGVGGLQPGGTGGSGEPDPVPVDHGPATGQIRQYGTVGAQGQEFAVDGQQLTHGSNRRGQTLLPNPGEPILPDGVRPAVRGLVVRRQCQCRDHTLGGEDTPPSCEHAVAFLRVPGTHRNFVNHICNGSIWGKSERSKAADIKILLPMIQKQRSILDTESHSDVMAGEFARNCSFPLASRGIGIAVSQGLRLPLAVSIELHKRPRVAPGIELCLQWERVLQHG